MRSSFLIVIATAALALAIFSAERLISKAPPYKLLGTKFEDQLKGDSVHTQTTFGVNRYTTYLKKSVIDQDADMETASTKKNQRQIKTLMPSGQRAEN